MFLLPSYNKSELGIIDAFMRRLKTDVNEPSQAVKKHGAEE